MGGAHDPEVAVVERGDRRLPEPFGDGDEGGVGQVETQIGVGGYQLDAALPVVSL